MARRARGRSVAGMHRTILVAATADDAGLAALALGVELARPVGAVIVLAGVAGGRYDMPEDEASLRARLQALAGSAPHDVTVRVEVAAGFVVDELARMAERHDASMIVLGHSHRGALERLVTGDVAVAAEAAVAAAVAVAPAAPGDGRLRTIGVAYDETPEAGEALEWAVQLAERTGARLRIIRVLEARHPEGTTPEAGTAERVHAVAAAAAPRAEATATLLWGDAAERLVAIGHELDLLVVGSRAHGAVWRSLVGGVSTTLVHDAPCPVVVIPPGVHAPADTAAA